MSHKTHSLPAQLKAGFTLLELSIVLVIIGLLIGGIFVGQSLIHTAQINAAISEFNRYQTATQNFKMQYNALPGDMSTAVTYWGSAGGTGADATCMAVASTTAATCNGNGDGNISTSISSNDEDFRYWQHLSNAKMIEGSFTGQCCSNLVGINVPASRINSSVHWRVSPTTTYAGGSAAAFNTDYGIGHYLFLSLVGTGITPKDAWAVDKKYDDGKPGMGNVIAYNWPVCSNAANMSDLTATYTLTTTTTSCGLIFLSSF